LGGTIPLLACGESSQPPTAAGNGFPSGETATGVVGSRAVKFASEDGLTLSGRLFGSGSSAVVLAHMYPADQTSWWSTAERLADEGYLVLTFDFRGYGESEGERDIARIDRDVTGAVSFLRTAGATQLILVGASMGGTACLKAAEQAQLLSSIRLAGVVTLSAPVEFKGLSAAEAVPRLSIPLLFIAAQEDVGAEGARQLNELASGAAELRILPGSEHGTRLLEGAQKEAVYRLLMDFLSKNFRQEPSTDLGGPT
jgi:pimeloyl-ACP methyl ester carboxylesterase